MSWPVRLAIVVATLVVLLSSVSSATAYRVVDGASAAHATYEPNGDRTAFSTPAGSLAATYDAQDRLLTHGSTSYTYGANGELATKTEGGQTTSYTFDALGELLRVALPDGRTVEYLYDGLQRRIAKKLNGAVVQGFLHGTEQGPIAELDGAGNVVSRFVYGTRSWSPDLIIQGATTYRVVADHLGSPRLVIDSANSAVAQRVDHDAWGALVANSAPTLQPFGFAGGLYDADTQLVHFGSRDYDPAVGRFISKDPAGLGGGANVYTYAANDPVNHLDSDGHVAILVPILTGAAVGGLEGAAFGIASSLVANGCIDWRAVGSDALSGAVGGAVGGGLGVAVKAWGGAARGGAAAMKLDRTAMRAESALQSSLLRQQLAAESVAGARLPSWITGYTGHGLARAISRDDVGVSVRAIRDAVKSPLSVFGKSNGTFGFVGRDATVVLNAEGQVITTWANGATGFRTPF